MKLSIAGVCVSIAGLSRKAMKSVESLYPGFLSEDDSDFELIVRSYSSKKLTESGIDHHPELEIFPKMIELTFPDAAGRINLVRNMGYLIGEEKTFSISLDYFLKVLFSVLIFEKGGLLVHSAGIKMQNIGYGFIGHSGAGKTTISKNSPFGEVLNDDLVSFLPNSNQDWKICSTPFSNVRIHTRNFCANLNQIFFLSKAERVIFEPIGIGEAISEFFANIPVLPQNNDWVPFILERVNLILTSTKFCRLHFTPDSSFWDLILSQSNAV